MGNEQPNQKFNPNFNMAAYNQKMNEIRSQYNQQPSFDMPGAYSVNKPNSQTMKCEQITRSVYIFKTTLQIAINNDGDVHISFQYHCSGMAKLYLGIGVTKIEQHEVTKQTINIACLRQDQQSLPGGDKMKFNKTYRIDRNRVNQVHKTGIMLKICSNEEYSEYSLTYIFNTKLWKVVVENFKANNKMYGIEDIYGGDQQGQQCIICFTNKANTMVKPCNHLCLCGECSQSLQIKTTNCPICRKRMTSLVKLSKDE